MNDMCGQQENEIRWQTRSFIPRMLQTGIHIEKILKNVLYGTTIFDTAADFWDIKSK